MRRPALAILAVSFLSAATCSNTSQPSTDALAVDLARAFCQHQFRCCSPVEIAVSGQGRYATEADCLDLATLSATEQLALIETAVTSGHITVDPAVAKACVDAYANGACNTSFELMEPITPLPDVGQAVAGCTGLYVGHVPAGSRCDLSEECAKGSRCVGTSTVLTAPGGFAGSQGTSPGTVTMGACVPFQGQGDRCNDSTDCDPSAHLYCRTPAFVCDLLPKQGEPCTSSRDSLGRLISECDTGGALYCDVNAMVCRHLPRAGEPCVTNQFPACDPDPALALRCNFFTGTCLAPAGEGEACGGSALPPCRADLACHPTQADGIGTCAAPPTVGQTCTDRCASPALCGSSVCQMPGALALGVTCTANEDCITLACAPFGSPTPVCVASGGTAICAGSGVTPGTHTGFGGSMGTGGRPPLPVGTGAAGAGGTAGASPIGAGGMTGGSPGGAGGMSGGPDMTGAGGMTGAAGTT